eukprot:TRINITY_DN68241_c0_g1_i1.p1 TRINITY_DN68241_c0_g1~~TRINITY_DN68241_c0_g1_i1.p1  ORF type:complete len:454 (-),score=20.00 TRINITY_DN68241_c0_g1_i1:246-1607(-)
MNKSIILLLGCIYLFKICWQGFRRLLYPYAPYFSDETGVSVTSISLVLSLSNIVYILAAFGFSALRRFLKHHHIFAISSAILAVSIIILATIKLSFALFIICAMFGYISLGLMEPGYQSMITLTIPTEHQGRVTGIVETAWGFISLVFLPFAGLLMSIEWHLPFILLLVMLAICATANWLLFRPLVNAHSTPQSPTKKTVQDEPILKKWKDLLTSRVPRGAVICMFLTAVAQNIIWISFSVWLRDDYHFTLAQVAGATVSQGIGDVGGEIIIAFLLWTTSNSRMLVLCEATQAVLLGLLCIGVAAGFGFWVNIIILVGVLVVVEMKVVTMFGFASQVASTGVKGCSILDSSVFGVMSAGALLGTYTGSLIYNAFSFTGCICTCVGCSLVSLAAIVDAIGWNKIKIQAVADPGEEQPLLVKVSPRKGCDDEGETEENPKPQPKSQLYPSTSTEP